MQHIRHIAAVALLGSTILAGTAQAGISLIAIGSLDPTQGDLATNTSGPLENGVAGNLLGGIGSGFAYAGGNTYLALPDRGPNADSYNAAVDNTASYIDRFQTLQLKLSPNASPGLPYVLTPTLSNTTLLSSPTPLVYGSGAGLGTTKAGQPMPNGAPGINTANTFYFTGRSDNFDPTKSSTNPANARLDPESIRVSNDGKSVFVSDEYGPYVRQFDRATGQLVKTFAVPSDLAVANQSPVGANEEAPPKVPGNTSGRVDNKGMEGLAITPDGKTLVGIMQAALLQDSGSKVVRIVTIDIATGQTHQYAYPLSTGSGVSEITAINDHEFLVDERDGSGRGNGDAVSADSKHLYKIDLKNAQEIADSCALPCVSLNGKTKAQRTAALLAAGATVKKTDFLNLVTLLENAGISAEDIPAKIEGMSFGQDELINGVMKHILYIANDNDFEPTVDEPHTLGAANPNQIFVFAIDQADLPTLDLQVVPEPDAGLLLLSGAGLLSLLATRRRRNA